MNAADTQVGRQDAAAHWLRQQGIVTEGDFRQAETSRAAAPNRPELIDHLVANGAIEAPTARSALQHMFPSERVVDVAAYLPGPETEGLLRSELSRRLGAVAIGRPDAHHVEFAVCDPYDMSMHAELALALGGELLPVIVLGDAHAIYERIARDTEHDNEHESEHHRVDVDDLTLRARSEVRTSSLETDGAIEAQVRNSAVTQLAEKILHDAVRLRASDIHIEFFAGFGWVRMRVDGVLQEWGKLPEELERDLIAHIKGRSNMDSSNRRVPQDGRLAIVVRRRADDAKGKKVELRVSTLPTVHGEKAVLRVLPQEERTASLDDLGFVGQSLAMLHHAMRQNSGMILLTGPTGSGKSTTLYSVLSELARPEVNIVTVEDPVERQIPMVTQVNIRATEDSATNLSYASVLKSVLRQDPNIIMIGEIRDMETAATATRAAMTGHLVLSTLHTNDAPSAVSRLMDIGVEPYNVAGTLRLVIAQRLLRRLCEHCKVEAAADPAQIAASGMDPRQLSAMRVFAPRGCPRCTGGFRGRIGVFEMLEVNDQIRRLVTLRKSDKEIGAAALANHMVPLRTAGWQRVREGITTIAEVLKET